DEETGWLTQAMIDSGDTVDLSSIPGIKVDKHSTGGVGDTTTLVLAPLVAAAGAKVAKMSGRGLGHTGGTLDKMEAVGLFVDLDSERFLQQVRDIGVAVISQTKKLVPADGVLYGLRDVTATIDSVPLIASSVMSKKLACGADAILLDVKFGDGAFMPDLESGRRLAHCMVEIGKRLGRRVRAALSDMDCPLGTHIGNALEFREAIEILRGERADSALAQVALELAAQLVVMSDLADSLEAARSRVRQLVDDGSALNRMRDWIKAQDGEPRMVDDLDLLPSAAERVVLRAENGGFVTQMQARAIGEAAMALGAGRQRKTDPVDPAVGVVLLVEPGQSVEKGQPLAELHSNDSGRSTEAMTALRQAIVVGPEAPAPRQLIREFIG
ncbi:MAG: thymidine phosphorylase, partial [Candidatus Eremiobacteraeota bacterium]|nr:thymidine phosphorylase [Candidatus Eremiobacteraeota bacterium]